MNNHISMIGNPVESFINLTIDELRDRYLSISPGKTSDDFNNSVILSLDQSPDVSGDEAINRYLNSLKQNIEIKTSTLPLVISVAYCLQAQQALFNDDREKAWSCVAEARYWCGSMLTKDEFETSVKDIEKATNIKKAKNAADVLHEQKYGKVKNTATDLAIRLMPLDGWKSRRYASFQIFDALKSSGELSPLTETQAQITIDGWLKEMPNSSELFSRSKAKKR